ncbi:hypothetical protein GALMADRAFT_161722 [Galerina marginata CBS 339.88]|uniref:Uncharacterized protein n=1 Tax=Galerina marginata (strain CBS 339.88) TaxID=685588 RepID=A0A067S8E3_GALM3|nr:hypothetical protein GALMADRAFT_161722 [Galerina marginata CBS 339.88]
MSSPDAVSLVALIVSLVALVLTLLQVAQQYIATASDYRHCSERTVGGWHRRSRRRFLWSELRFEVHFATPIIQVGVIPTDIADRDPYAIPVSESEKTPSNLRSASGAQYILHTSEGDKIYSSSQKPWFLDLQGTRPEAQCTWLSLLNDVTITRLQIGVDERTLSYDFMPDGIKKPLAQMDRKSFLTLMSLFQVSWQEGWGREIGEKPESGGGKRETPSGAGPYCEVTSRILANFGTVISYRSYNLQPTRKFYIVSERARSAMFNRFDLGFHVALTHSSDEAYITTLALADESSADTVQGLYQANNGYAPGLAEVIICFAEAEMPKAIEHGTDDFVSVFSARSLGTIFDTHAVGRLLEGDAEIENSNADAQKFASWAKDYISSSSAIHGDMARLPADQLRAALKIANSYFGKESQRRDPISWSESRKCLDVIKLLDRQLSTLCRLLAPNQSELSVHRELAQLQIRFGCTVFNDTSARAEPSGGYWIDFVGVLVAEKYVEICATIGKKYPDSRDEVTRGYVINRLMRGLLWRIHNGNCSSNQSHDERLLECSLNSRWLSDASTLWID